jgi:hypothetical protein
MMSMAPRFMDVRGKLPATYLNSLSELSVSYGEGTIEVPNAPPDTPKILVQQRPSATNEEAWLKRIAPLIARGWVLVSELDDHPNLFQEVRGVENRGVRLPAGRGPRDPDLHRQARRGAPRVQSGGQGLLQRPVQADSFQSGERVR